MPILRSPWMTRSKERKYLSLKKQKKKAQLQGDLSVTVLPTSPPGLVLDQAGPPLQAMSSPRVDGAHHSAV